MTSQPDLTSSNLDLHDRLMSNIKKNNISPPIELVDNANDGENEDEEEDEAESEYEDDDSQYTYATDLVDPLKEWEQNVIQLRTLLDFVILPLVGKLLGRRFAHFVWGRIAELIF